MISRCVLPQSEMLNCDRQTLLKDQLWKFAEGPYIMGANLATGDGVHDNHLEGLELGMRGGDVEA